MGLVELGDVFEAAKRGFKMELKPLFGLLARQKTSPDDKSVSENAAQIDANGSSSVYLEMGRDALEFLEPTRTVHYTYRALLELVRTTRFSI